MQAFAKERGLEADAVASVRCTLEISGEVRMEDVVDNSDLVDQALAFAGCIWQNAATQHRCGDAGVLLHVADGGEFPQMPEAPVAALSMDSDFYDCIEYDDGYTFDVAGLFLLEDCRYVLMWAEAAWIRINSTRTGESCHFAAFIGHDLIQLAALASKVLRRDCCERTETGGLSWGLLEEEDWEAMPGSARLPEDWEVEGKARRTHAMTFALKVFAANLRDRPPWPPWSSSWHLQDYDDHDERDDRDRDEEDEDEEEEEGDGISDDDVVFDISDDDDYGMGVQ